VPLLKKLNSNKPYHMPDTNPQQDPKKIQDIETEGVAPTIKRYNDTQAGTTPPPAPAPAKVNPTGPAPTNQAPVAKASASASAPKDPIAAAAAKKKAIFGCVGGFGALMLISLILSFVFLAQTGNGTSPIARLLGINEGVFINGLITFVHIIFILISLVAFIFTMVGLFKASMVRADDKDGRRAALRTSLISGIVLFLVLIVWGFAYVYLDSKRVQISADYTQPIVTTPTDTLGLTAPIEVKFDASNIPLDRTRYQIVSHDWDFGDKSSGTGQITSHIYKDKGTYNVKLVISVKDKNSGKISTGGEYSTTISVESLALSAIFNVDNQSGEAPLDVNFDASSSADPDGTIAKYEWDFTGDGQYKDGTGKTIKHTFDKIGKYKVSLRVTSTTGKSNTSDKEIDVVESVTPMAAITVVDEPTIYGLNQSYVFSGDSSTSPNGNITKYEWTFSDNAKKVETTKTVSHIFKTPGTQQIHLKVTDEKGKTGEIDKVITIETPKGVPKAKITTDQIFDAKTGMVSGKAPFTVAFDASGTTDSDNNIVDYQWDFDGDGKFDAFGVNTSHTYTEDGTYNATLNVVDADKNVGSATIKVQVAPEGIAPSLKADVADGNIPLSVNFDASASSYAKGQISGYKWDFGDGTPIKMGSATLTHKYTAIGTFTATVTVLGSDNTSASKSMTINVREIPLSACFVSVFEKGPAPLNTTFDPSCSTGTATSYSWNFGDGTTSTDVKPGHTFEKEGTYKVTLELSDAQNTVSKSEVTITVTAK